MALDRRTYREADGERIEGTWRPIFIRNGTTYFLTDLLVYADGTINCWEWVDLDGLREMLENGWVATRLEHGAEASAHHLARWRFDGPQMWVTAEELLGEVADEIDELNGRPDSTDRCLRALGRFLRTRTEADRQSLRGAYQAIPAHMRHYALGDMDAKDWPLRVLSTEVGEHTPDGELVTESMHDRAHEYFEENDWLDIQWHDQPPVDGPDQPQDPTVELMSAPRRWPTQPGVECLRNEYPTPIDVGGASYASAVHAYWSLAATDETARAAIRDADTALNAERAAAECTRREDWPHLRLTVMHAVLRAKFGQHPELADVLVSTGDARIEYSTSAAYWSDAAGGRNWLGRLLELVRSEIVAHRAGFLP